VRQTKRAAVSGRAEQWQAREALERELVQRVRASGDGDIGRRAFLEKQSPVYSAVDLDSDI
jgi:hypothetical protein